MSGLTGNYTEVMAGYSRETGAVSEGIAGSRDEGVSHVCQCVLPRARATE